MINITLWVLCGVISFKPDLSAILQSSTRPSKRPFFLLDAFSKSIIFKPQPAELLMLCCVTVQSKQMQLQMSCFVSLQERPLKSHVFEPHIFEPRIFDPYSSKPHISEPCTLEPHVSKPCSDISKPCFHISELRSHVFKPHIFEPRFYVFEPHAFGPHVYKLHSPGSTLWIFTILVFYTSSTLIPIYQILVYRTFVQLHRFWDVFWSDLVGGPIKTILEVWSWAVGL